MTAPNESRASSETVRNATPQEQNEQQKTLPEPADAPPELATTLWNDKADSYDGDDNQDTRDLTLSCSYHERIFSDQLAPGSSKTAVIDPIDRPLNASASEHPIHNTPWKRADSNDRSDNQGSQDLTLSYPYHARIVFDQLALGPPTTAVINPIDRFLNTPASEYPIYFTGDIRAGSSTSAGCTCNQAPQNLLDRMTREAIRLLVPDYELHSQTATNGDKGPTPSCQRHSQPATNTEGE